MKDSNSQSQTQKGRAIPTAKYSRTKGHGFESLHCRDHVTCVYHLFEKKNI